MKTYSNASNARRAAKAAGLTAFTLVKEGTGFAIVEAPAPAPAPRKAKAPKATAKAPKKAARKAPAPTTGETKIAQLTRMCSRGASITELTETLGWLPHTVRGALSRLGSDGGYAVTRTKVGAEAHYKIAS
jgi:Protein of unknown function (DUF3489)